MNFSVSKVISQTVQIPRFLCIVYTDSTTIQIQFPYHTRTLFWYRHTNMTFPPPGSCSSVYRETILTVLSLLFLVFSILILLTLEMCKYCWFKYVIENEKNKKINENVVSKVLDSEIRKRRH